MDLRLRWLRLSKPPGQKHETRNTNNMKNGHVVHEIDDNGIATIEFGHPQSNSLPGAILEKLRKTITDVGAQDNVKVIILKSHGDRAFCGGASFDELVAINDEKTGLQFSQALQT